MDANKPYDLEKRTLEFAKDVIKLCKMLPKSVISSKIISQLIRSSGSVGANYREANEKLSKKDFIHRMRIARKECKESSYWLELLKEVGEEFMDKINVNIKESKEIRNIFTAIIDKSK
ncbi:MAG: four helix bundle protein [Candidatus Omnitrophica bacterium]|nr:four helix bundle protein [Candidatus Omnitrophota bacterium]